MTKEKCRDNQKKATLLQSIPVSLKENIKNFFEKTSHFNVLTIFNII